MNSDKAGTDDLRKRMVRSQIISRGVLDPRVVDAMKSVPRELFVGGALAGDAFDDTPLPIGFGQTISQPYIVAYMTEQLGLGKSDRVLEIGTGSGYQTAILASIASAVYTVEIISELSERASRVLSALGYGNIHYRTGDGSRGWPEEAPFDAIIVTAAPESVPEALPRQLAEGGRMVIPVGVGVQYLRKLTRKGDRIEDESLIGVRFVPLTGGIEEGGR